jgi:hypothetical protein
MVAAASTRELLTSTGRTSSRYLLLLNRVLFKIPVPLLTVGTADTLDTLVELEFVVIEALPEGVAESGGVDIVLLVLPPLPSSVGVGEVVVDGGGSSLRTGSMSPATATLKQRHKHSRAHI